MNSTVLRQGTDFIVLKDESIISKFFIYNFETREYRCTSDGITPVKYNSRYECYNSYMDGDEVVHSYNQLPTYIKKFMR